jgi:hypothetical protein
MNYTIVKHLYRPQDTISAVIRKHNGLTISKEQLTELQQIYNELNGFTVPKAFTTADIPVFIHEQLEDK